MIRFSLNINEKIHTKKTPAIIIQDSTRNPISVSSFAKIKILDSYAKWIRLIIRNSTAAAKMQRVVSFQIPARSLLTRKY
mgnify:CR=1 FL=1